MNVKCSQCSNVFPVPEIYKDKQIKCVACKEPCAAVPYTEVCHYCGNSIAKPEKACKLDSKFACHDCFRKISSQREQARAKQNKAKIINASPKCHLCHEVMEPKTVTSGSAAGWVLGILTLVIGLSLTFGGAFCGGFLFGVPLCIFSFFIMGGKDSKVLCCRGCGATVNRTD